MGKVGEENGVLKLVRAGGIVELYKHPIKAAQVMERYPRHFVTRPDVFKFPNIVVKPESILKPGQVFYIVPYHTIYRLLKSKGYRSHNHHTPADHDEAINKLTLDNIRPIEGIDTSFFHEIISVETIRNNTQINQQVSNHPMEENRNTCASKVRDYDSDEALDAASCFPIRIKGGGVVEAKKDTASRNGIMTCLKSCLKNQRTNKPRSQQGPRVRFTLPDEDGNDTDFAEF